MNDSQKRPLIGLLVLLAGLFLLSELLPGTLPESGESGVPSTTLPLGASSGAAAPDQLSADTPAAPSAPDAKIAQAPEAGPQRPVDASAPPLGAAGAPSRPAPQPAPAASAALPASVSSMPRLAAQDSTEDRPAPPRPAAAKPAEAKPKDSPKDLARPASPAPVAAPAPALKLAQTLPAPSKAPAPPPPAARPAPPPVPPTPRLATSVQAPPPPVAAGQGRLWFVQIGSFADQGNAQTTLNLLQNIGFRGEASKITSSAGSALYRVRLGPFPSEAVAQQAYNKVSHQGYPQARVLSEGR